MISFTTVTVFSTVNRLSILNSPSLSESPPSVEGVNRKREFVATFSGAKLVSFQLNLRPQSSINV